jgi:hypothetical protein
VKVNSRGGKFPLKASSTIVKENLRFKSIAFACCQRRRRQSQPMFFEQCSRYEWQKKSFSSVGQAFSCLKLFFNMKHTTKVH